MQMREDTDVRIESMAYGGEALGRLPDGRVVFVPFAIPGELVRLRLVEEKPRHARGELVEVLEPASERIVARCRHFTNCGGCYYQHMSYPSQLKVKATILKEQLERLGGLRDLPDVEVIAAPKPWNYRNNLQFHITSEGKLGFQMRRSNQTFAIQECHLPEAAIDRIWPQLEIEPDPALERISLRVGEDEDAMLVLESSDLQAVEFSIEDLAISAVQTSPAGNIILAGSDYIVMEAAGKRFRVSAGSFFQVNSLLAPAMVGYLIEHLPLDKDATVLDVYSGVGLFSAFIAPKVKHLVGIELSAQACEDFVTNLDGFDNVELYEDEAENVLRQIGFHPDVIVMDPPRAGLGVPTVEGVLAQEADRLAYISCDPATLARDARQLVAGGYSLVEMTLLDMFPQTYHIESISLWDKKG